MTVAAGDSRSLAVARAASDAGKPALTILYGSRARGDYEDATSDIDILMMQENPPSSGQKASARQAAIRSAKAHYGREVEVQIVWYTAEEFERNRRTVNHLVARALDEGIIMSHDSDTYANRYQDGSENDHTYEWTVTEQRVRHAEIHLETFRLIHASEDLALVDRMAGKNGQEALEHALKGLISANNARYARTHLLTQLVDQVEAADPEFSFRPSLDYTVLEQYAGHDDYYEPERLITDVADYFTAITNDVQRLLARIREITGGRG